VKFFTREYWLGLQRRDYTLPPPEADPHILYRKELEGLRGRVADDAFHFFAEADVHDGELLDLSVVDGNRPAPLGQPAREWTDEPGFPVRYDAEADLFPSGSGGGFGFGDWGYDELRDAGDGFLAHEILFATGATILVEFRTVAVRSAPARPAAGEDPSPT